MELYPEQLAETGCVQVGIVIARTERLVMLWQEAAELAGGTTVEVLHEAEAVAAFVSDRQPGATASYDLARHASSELSRGSTFLRITEDTSANQVPGLTVFQLFDGLRTDRQILD